MKYIKAAFVLALILSVFPMYAQAKSTSNLGILRKCVGVGWTNGCLEYNSQTGKAMYLGHSINPGEVKRFVQFKTVTVRRGTVTLVKQSGTNRWYRWIDWDRP